MRMSVPAGRVMRAGLIAGALAGVCAPAWAAPASAAMPSRVAAPPGCHGPQVKHGKRIDWYDVADDAWRPFDMIHSAGHR